MVPIPDAEFNLSAARERSKKLWAQRNVDLEEAIKEAAPEIGNKSMRKLVALFEERVKKEPRNFPPPSRN